LADGWGGAISFDDNHVRVWGLCDFAGAILHRGMVPTRFCPQERPAIADMPRLWGTIPATSGNLHGPGIFSPLPRGCGR